MKPKEEEASLDVKEKGQGGDSDQEMMNLENELYSLTHYADDEEELVAQMFATIKGSKLEAMMPPILKEIPLIDVQQLCLHELRGMSQRRILSIINGQEMSGSSSEDSDSEKKPIESNENIENENDDSKVPNVTIKIEPESEDLLTGKDLSELENINESNLTTLDILELEMRAKLIKTMLEKQEGDEGKDDEEGTNGLVPDIKIKEEPLTPESTHNEDNVSRHGSPESHRRSRHSRRKRKDRRRSDSRSYSSSRSSSRSSFSSKSRSKSRTPSRSRSHSRSMSYTPELKKEGSESPKSKKHTKKKISRKEFEARMQKAKMNRRYRKRKESEEESGEVAKAKQISNETEEPSENPPDQTEENNVVPSEEKNTEENEAGNEEPAEEGEVEEKEEGEIDSNEEALSRSSRSYSRSYSSDSYSSYSSSRSRSYSRSPKRRRSRKSKKKRRHRRRRSRSRSLSDVPKIPNWKPEDSTISSINLDSSNAEPKIDTKPEPKKTLPSKEDRQSISFSISKKSNTAIKKSSELGDETLTSTAMPEDTDQDDNDTEEGNSKNICDDKVADEKSMQIESEDAKPHDDDDEGKPQAAAVIAEDFYKGADQLNLSDEGECEDEKDIEKVLDDNNTLTESNASRSFTAKASGRSKTVSSKHRKRKAEVISVYEEETVLSEDLVNIDSPYEASDIPKDSEEAVEEISQISSLPDVGEDSTQDVLEPLPELEPEDSRESHNLEIIGVIDPAEKQNDGFDEDIAAGGSSWSMRWLQSEKVQKVVSNSKMLSKVRKKIQAKGKGMVKEAQAKSKGIVKEAPKPAIPKQTIVEAKPESPKIEVKLQPKTASNVIGSIEEYEKLVGIKVKAPTSLPQPKPQTKPAPSQAISTLLDSDDDEDSEEEAIWSKIMKK
ncbi:UNVERIFIED_CONTAM: hypothetical protein RMT77_000725 [Armadillidium vulgare]